MFLYIAYNFYIYKVSSLLYLPFPRSPSRGPAIYVFLVIGGNAYFLLCRFLQTFTPCNFIAVSHLKAVQVCKT